MQINQYTMNIFAISILMAAKRGNINSRNIDKLLKHAIKITPRYKLTENHSLNIEQLYKRIFPNEDYNIDYLFLKNLHKYCGIVIEDDLHEYIVDNSSIWHDIIQLGNKIVQIDADSEVSSDIAKEKKNVVKKEILSLHQEMVIKGSICSQLFNTIENLSLETIDSYIEEKEKYQRKYHRCCGRRIYFICYSICRS